MVIKAADAQTRFYPTRIHEMCRVMALTPALLSTSVSPQQGYVLGSHHVSICGQSGRIFTEVCQEGQAEAVAEFVPVPLSGQTHRAHALAAAQG